LAPAIVGRFLRGLSTFSRVIVFDRRSMGMSDRDPLRKAPSLDERVADIRTVMKAAASPRAALLGHSEGGPACLQLAASYPEQVSALILHATSARFSVSPNFPHGISPQFMKLGIEVHQELGSGRGFELLAPSLGSDSTARRRWAAYERLAAAPDEITGPLRMLLELDLRHLLPCIRAPCLSLTQRTMRLFPWIAAATPLARFVALSISSWQEPITCSGLVIKTSSSPLSSDSSRRRQTVTQQYQHPGKGVELRSHYAAGYKQ
jgi:pimeloyl-ACP methyl ester carboxylesterase